jgi:hypothetical protein
VERARRYEGRVVAWVYARDVHGFHRNCSGGEFTTCKGRWNSRGGSWMAGPPIAMTWSVRIFEVDPGRWRVEWGSGLGLEVVLLFSRTVAFWRWGGELFAEVPIGEA